ncbi:hypothetical protein OIV83_004558 [Microbotryomycetes sp. JL201]|nr:hypothetical protein OIV83_004558 [Microbotryomycetes sp. JL201]
MHIRTITAAAAFSALLATPHVLAKPQPGLFDRIGDAWDDLIHGPRDQNAQPVIAPIESVQPAMSASKLVSEVQASMSQAAKSQSSASVSRASAVSNAHTRSRRFSAAGSVPQSSFESDSESQVDVEVGEDKRSLLDTISDKIDEINPFDDDEQESLPPVPELHVEEEKRSLLDSVSDAMDDLNPFSDGQEDSPPVKEWVQGSKIIQDYTPTDGLLPPDQNAILLSDSYSILSTPSLTATAELLKILPTSLSGDQLSSLAAAISSMQASAASVATATTTGKANSMTPPASSASLKGKNNKVTIVVDAAMLETAFFNTPSPTTATINAKAKMTPGPVNLEAEAKVPMASGGAPGPIMPQPVAIELDTEDDDQVSFLGPVTPLMQPVNPVIAPDQIIPLPPFGLDQLQVDIERRASDENSVIIQDDTPGADTMPIGGKASKTPRARGSDLPRATVFPGPPDGLPGLKKSAQPAGQAGFSVDKGFGRPPQAGQPVGSPSVAPNDAAYDAPPLALARRHSPMTTQSVYHALMHQREDPAAARPSIQVPRQPVAEYVQKQRSLLQKTAQEIQDGLKTQLEERLEERRLLQEAIRNGETQRTSRRQKRFSIEFKKVKREKRRLFFEGKKMDRIIKHNETLGGSPDGSVWSVRYLKKGVLAELEERGDVVNVTRSKIQTLLEKAQEEGKSVEDLGLSAAKGAVGDKLNASQHVWVTRDKWDKLVELAGPLQPRKDRTTK